MSPRVRSAPSVASTSMQPTFPLCAAMYAGVAPSPAACRKRRRPAGSPSETPPSDAAP